MHNFKRTAKVQKGKIVISEEVQALIKKPVKAPLFTIPAKSSVELERELVELKQEIDFKMQIDFSYCNEPIPHCPIIKPLLGTDEEVKESIVEQRIDFYTGFKKLMSSKKKTLKNKRNSVIWELLDKTIDAQFTEELFPKLLLYLEEVNKKNLNMIMPTYKMYNDKIKELKQQLKK